LNNTVLIANHYHLVNESNRKEYSADILEWGTYEKAALRRVCCVPSWCDRVLRNG
jgi:hypothetical protein